MPHVVERTVFEFAELSERAKERARERWRDGGQHDEWWKYIYEDAVAVAECLGICISTHGVKLHGGGTRQDPDIFFSGFCSQGDGACWFGRYVAKLDAVQAIQAYAPQDEELLRIARELVIVQMTSFLECGCYLEAKVTQGGTHYSHSGTMNAEVTYAEWSDDGIDEAPENTADTVTQLLRDFADWIYEQLEAENEYLNSDGCIDPQLAEREFNEDGTII